MAASGVLRETAADPHEAGEGEGVASTVPETPPAAGPLVEGGFFAAPETEQVDEGAGGFKAPDSVYAVDPVEDFVDLEAGISDSVNLLSPIKEGEVSVQGTSHIDGEAGMSDSVDVFSSPKEEGEEEAASAEPAKAKSAGGEEDAAPAEPAKEKSAGGEEGAAGARGEVVTARMCHDLLSSLPCYKAVEGTTLLKALLKPDPPMGSVVPGASPKSTDSPLTSGGRPAAGDSQQQAHPKDATDLLSKGTAWHKYGDCWPCHHIVRSKRCKQGAECNYCHAPQHAQPHQRPSKQKREQYRKLAQEMLDEVDANPQAYDQEKQMLAPFLSQKIPKQFSDNKQLMKKLNRRVQQRALERSYRQGRSVGPDVWLPADTLQDAWLQPMLEAGKLSQGGQIPQVGPWRVERLSF